MKSWKLRPWSCEDTHNQRADRSKVLKNSQGMMLEHDRQMFGFSEVIRKENKKSYYIAKQCCLFHRYPVDLIEKCI